MEQPPLKEIRWTAVHTPYYALVGGKKVRVSGATTVKGILKSKGLNNWFVKCGSEGVDPEEEMKRSGRVGTIAHFLLEAYLTNEYTPNLGNCSKDEIAMATSCFERFRKWYESQDFTILNSELQLVCSDKMFGGTIDAIAKDSKGRLVLLDWKTSKSIYDDFELQVAAYKYLYSTYKKKVGEIERVIIANAWSKEPSHFQSKEYDNLDNAWRAFDSLRGTYLTLKDTGYLPY